MHATHHRQVVAEQAAVQHRANRVQIILLADHEIVGTVPGGGVHQAGTRIGGHVITKNHRHLRAQERMLQSQHFQLVAFHGSRAGHAFHCPALHQIIRQRLGHQ